MSFLSPAPEGEAAPRPGVDGGAFFTDGFTDFFVDLLADFRAALNAPR
jgi:hypothetical protein